MDEKPQLKSKLEDILSSEGWIFIKQKFVEKIKALENISNIDEKLTPEMQAIQIKANKEAIKIINDILREIVAVVNAKKREKKSYV